MKSDHRRWPGLDYPQAPGECRFCGELILTASGRIDLRRGFCCRAHSQEYWLRADWQAMRRFVFKRDDGICQECGRQHEFGASTWQCDHVKPLFAATDWSFWDHSNCQVLCDDPCHRRKTVKDLRRFRKQRDIVERRRKDPPMRSGGPRGDLKKRF